MLPWIDSMIRPTERWLKRHANEVDKALRLIERSPYLELLSRSASGDHLLANFACKTLRTVPERDEPIERNNTPVHVVCPIAGLFEFTHLRVATELLPRGERPFNPHIRPDELGIICTGDKWTPATFGLDLLIVTAWDILRGDNVISDSRDTYNSAAVPFYQRLSAEGKLPLDKRSVI